MSRHATREANTITAVLAVVCATAVASSVSPTVEHWLNVAVVWAAAGVGVVLVGAAARWALAEWSLARECAASRRERAPRVRRPVAALPPAAPVLDVDEHVDAHLAREGEPR